MSSASAKIRAWREYPAQFVHDNFGVEPDAWQVDTLNALGGAANPTRRVGMKACTGPGKLQLPGDVIETTNGFKTFEDLSPGEYVYDADGLPTRVLGKIKWNDQAICRFTFRDKTTIDVGEHHMWKAFSAPLKSFRRGRVVSTKEMIDIGPTTEYENGRVVTRFYIQQAGKLVKSEKDLAVDPYVLGCWLGDGARKSGSIIKDDEDLFRNIESMGYKTTRHIKHESAGQRYNIAGLRRDLRLLGVGDFYSHQRYIPQQYKDGSIEQRTKILQGLLDTDGRVKTNGMVDFHSTSKQLIDDVSYLVESLGGQAIKRMVDTHRDRDCHSVGVVVDFNPFTIKRKADRWRKPPEWKMRRHIQSIEYVGRSDGYCIEVDNDDHLYQANHGIVTHNSTLLAWAGWQRLSCFAKAGEHPKGAALSITRENLKDNLWTELSKWRDRSEFLKAAFEVTKERIYAYDHPDTWFLSARSFSKDADADAIGRALSGLHSQFPFLLLDETGDMPVQVLRTAEQIFTGSPEDALILAAGNPTSTNGLLYHICTSGRSSFIVITVTADPDDPKRTPRVSKELARQQIEDHGRDNPWVMATILGLFPKVGFNNLIGIEDVEKAMKRVYRPDAYSFAAKILGVDVAREGNDRSTICPRQGLVAFKPKIFRNAKSNVLAGHVAMAEDKWEADGVIVDGTGGYGSGVIDAYDTMGRVAFDCQFAGKPFKAKFVNKRAEILWDFCEWTKNGGALPYLPELIKEMTAVTYTFRGDKILVEPKEQVKAKIGVSPDLMDGYAVTFAFPIQPRPRSGNKEVGIGLFPSGQKPKQNGDYNPLEEYAR